LQTCLLYLMRHGETDWNRRGVIMGHSLVPLNATGRQQAARLAEAVRNVPFAALYASDLDRAAETARILATGRALPVQLDRRLREKDAGRFTGMSFDDVLAGWPEWAAEYDREPLTTRPPEGDSFADEMDRVVAFVSEVAGRHPGQTVGLVTHGGPIRCLAAHILGISILQLHPLDLDNGSVTLVEWGVHPRLRLWNWRPELTDPGA